MLKNKPGKSAAWLPSQVAYGIDTSDPDPSRWSKFGRLHEEAVAAQASKHGSPKPVPTQ